MKVKGLIKLLQGHNQEVEILITWEGIFTDIEDDNIYIAKNGKVVIDADGNFYKKRIKQGIDYIP